MHDSNQIVCIETLPTQGGMAPAQKPVRLQAQHYVKLFIPQQR